MWYFSWVLGTAMAVLLAIVNALWFENQLNKRKDDSSSKI
jgi:cytochrome bd-I ubiquinol oxidase subunit X